MSRRSAVFVSSLLLMVVTGPLASVRAAPGFLDTTFSFDGKSVESLGTGGGSNTLLATVVQPDGKIVGVGNVRVGTTQICALIRRNADGTPDTSFGSEGGLTVQFGVWSECYALGLQPDGKIVAGGYSYNGLIYSFTLFRFNANGSFDPSFDGDGKAVTSFEPVSSSVRAIAIQSDGKIVAAGSGGGYTVVRYNPNGSLDTTFSGDGIVHVQITGTDQANAVAVQADGKIVVAGSSYSQRWDMSAARFSADGVLDNSFDGDGTLTTSFTGNGSGSSSVAIQTDGKIVTAGYCLVGSNLDMVVVRYNLDGSADNSFDGDGRVTTDFAGNSERADALAIQSDGKIVAAGYSGTSQSNDAALVRYNPDGSLDASFDGDGKLTTAIGEFDYAQDLVIQTDGRYMVVGYSLAASANPLFALLRYNPDGSFDTSFDGDGILLIGMGGPPSSAQAVAVQPDGKMVAVGYSGTGASLDFTLVRYNRDGSHDTSFDGDGKVTTDFLSGSDHAFDVAVQADGKLVVAGAASDGVSDFFALARYNGNGSLDNTFSGDGKLTTAVTSISSAYALAIQSDGKIVAGGLAYNGANSDFAVVRYNANGSLDTSFDGDGKITFPVLSSQDEIYALVLQPDGKIVASGSAYNGASYDFAVARLNTNGSLDSSFDGDGRVTTALATSRQGAEGLALQSDGKIVTAGLTNLNGTTQDDFGLVRYNPNGSRDTSFDGDGILVTNVSGGDLAHSVVVQTDGKIIAAGGSGSDMSLVRYNPNGSLDSSYGTGGKALVDLGGSDQAFDMVLDSMGRAVVVGDSGGLFAVARVLGDRPLLNVPFDYDGDGRSDISVFRPSAATWYLNRSSAGFLGMQFGIAADKMVPADYDGDGKTDIAVYRPSEGRWFIMTSSDNKVVYHIFGLAEDLPAPADYDGDGKADICVFRPSTGTWYRQNSSNGSFFGLQFGMDGDRPTVGDFDGDGKSDIGIWRPSNGDWYHIKSSDGSIFGERFGISTDKMVPADYDGDGKTDIAVWRPSDSIWYIKRSSDNSYASYLFGLPTDIPTPGDFDGDGKADRAVFRPSDGTWYITNSANGSFTVFPWGLNADLPTHGAFLN